MARPSVRSVIPAFVAGNALSEVRDRWEGIKGRMGGESG